MGVKLPYVQQRRLDAVNSKLHAGTLRVAKGRLCYRSNYFPPRPGHDRAREGNVNRYDVSLRLSVDALLNDGIYREMELRVYEMDVAVYGGRFEWPKLNDSEVKLAGDLFEAFEEWHWAQVRRDTNREDYFKSEYRRRFRWFDANKPIDTKLILKVLYAKTKPESRSRQQASMLLSRFARFAGLDHQAIKQAGKGWKASDLNPRVLPTPDEIWEDYEALREKPLLRSGFVLLVTYGIRPHEMVYCSPTGLAAKHPYIHVSNGKTGARDAMRLLAPGWPTNWQWDGKIPKVNLRKRNGQPRSNKELGNCIADMYRGRVQHTLYLYRHHYAAMGFRQNKPVDKVALSMGHSKEIHQRTYRRWINADDMQQAWD
jgi:hypothetical protein